MHPQDAQTGPSPAPAQLDGAIAVFDGVAGVDAEHDDSGEQEDRPERREEDKLDRGIQPVVGSPDADEEVHRDEDDFEEGEEEQQVERDEDAEEPGLEDQHRDHELLGALCDRLRRGNG